MNKTSKQENKSQYPQRSIKLERNREWRRHNKPKWRRWFGDWFKQSHFFYLCFLYVYFEFRELNIT